jgi:hypothetical protein
MKITRPFSMAKFALGLTACTSLFAPSIADAGPLGISNLYIWLDGADTSTVTIDGGDGKVSEWHDKAGADNVASQVTSARRPDTGSTINGRSVVTFTPADAAGDQLVGGSPVLGDSDRTVIFVASPFESNLSDIAVGLGSSTSNRSWGITNKGVYAWAVNDYESFAQFNAVSPLPGNTPPQINAITYDSNGGTGGGHTGVFNRYTTGSQVTTSEDPATLTEYNTNSGYRVGNWSDQNRGFNGHVAEVLVFNKAINNAERVVVDNYLAAKWDLSLASGDHYAGSQTGAGNFGNEVFGIGQHIDGSELSASGGGFGGLELNEASNSLGTDEWVLAGHNAATGLSGGLDSHWNRTWYIDQTGTVDTTLVFDWTDAGLGSIDPAYVRLYYHASDSALVGATGFVGSIAGDQVTFNLLSADLLNGYYTLGITPVAEPSSVVLLGLAMFGLFGIRRRRR